MSFSKILSKRFMELGISETAGSKRMGVTQPFVNNIVNKKSLPSADRLVDWANALDLHDEARAEFLIAGIAEHAPQAISELLEKHFARKVTRLRDGGDVEYVVILSLLDEQREIAAQLAQVETERDALKAQLAAIEALIHPQPIPPAKTPRKLKLRAPLVPTPKP